jgi:hypothetical protein
MDGLKESPTINKALSRKKIFLADQGIAHNLGSLSIRCIRFCDLAIPKHISIFKAYDLVSDAFRFTAKTGSPSRVQPSNRSGFLNREDGRIENGAELENHLSTRYGTTIINSMSKLNYAQKAALLSPFQTLLLPPGSDNINAFCFAPKTTKLIQLTPIPNQDILSSPFYSYAGIRYALPFLDRIALVPSIAVGSQGLNSGKWHTQDIDEAISRATTLQAC